MSTNPYSDMGGGSQFQPSQFGGPSLGGAGGDFEAARAKIQAPAITLMVFAIVFALILLLLLILNVLGVSILAAAGPNNAQGAQALRRSAKASSESPAPLSG